MARPRDVPVWRRMLELCVPYLGIKRRGEAVDQAKSRDRTVLRRALPGWQILMITIGGVIGVTIFSTHGEILRLAGPGGLLIATLFVALTMICVMECIGELVILWPVSNAMVEYVRAFVDPDLAIIVGIAYWYAFSCIFATLIIIAANFASFTIASNVGRGVLFYAIIPFALFLINILGVEYYGFIEGVGGIAKLLMVASGIFFMIAKSPSAGTTNLDDGFQYQASAVDSKIEAICVSIPLLAYGYIGTEVVSVTAFEAINRKELRFPARAVSYIIALLYFISALLQCFLVNYDDTRLQSVVGATPPASNLTTSQPHLKRSASKTPDFYPVIMIAATDYGSDTASRYFNGCIIYFCISAANTALYVSSRTLFGLTRGLANDHSIPIFLKPLRYFGTTTPTRQVPLFALLFSALAFYWIVPLQLSKGFEISDMLAIMSTTASIGILIVWAAQCIAYIRYYCWFRRFRDLELLPPRYNRWDPQRDAYETHRHRMLMSDLRLIPAVAGLSGCFWIIFVFSTANWWNDGHVTLKKLATAYAGPIILTCLFIMLKLWNWRGWVYLPIDNETLATVTGNLERSSNLRHTTDTMSQVGEQSVVRRDGDIEFVNVPVPK